MALVTKYCTFSDVETGKGFITPAESKEIKFSTIGTIAKVYGEQTAVDTWISKVKASTATEQNYIDASKATSKLEDTVSEIKTTVDEILVIVKKV